MYIESYLLQVIEWQHIGNKLKAHPYNHIIEHSYHQATGEDFWELTLSHFQNTLKEKSKMQNLRIRFVNFCIRNVGK